MGGKAPQKVPKRGIDMYVFVNIYVYIILFIVMLITLYINNHIMLMLHDIMYVSNQGHVDSQSHSILQIAKSVALWPYAGLPATGALVSQWSSSVSQPQNGARHTHSPSQMPSDASQTDFHLDRRRVFVLQTPPLKAWVYNVQLGTGIPMQQP